MTNIVLWCTILSQKTLKSFCFIIVYQNLGVYCFEVAPKTKCVRETLRFMFLSKRRLLIKRLLKLRVCGPHEAPGALEEGDNLLKKLEEHQLEMLVAAVESRGADLSACVLLPQDEDVVWHVVSCRLWRWNNLQDAGQVRRLPGCRSAQDPVYICCNPYHWSRLYEPGTLELSSCLSVYHPCPCLPLLQASAL